MSAVKVTLDGARIAAEMRSPTGPLARHLLTRAEEFKQMARKQINDKSGCLSGSIVKRFEETPTGIRIRVIADTSPCSRNHESYALAVHEGTKEHVIEGNPLLAFPWDNGPEGAGMYFFASVKHPGTKPNRFFTDNLHIFLR